jgi:hypothetical protein
LGTLDTYRQRLEQVLTRLTALEFQNAVVLDDVLVVLQRAEMISRMAQRITRDCVELGSEGRLIRLQLEELVGDVPGKRDAVVRDYHALGAGEDATAALVELSGLSYQALLEFGRLAEVLGYDRGVNPLDLSVCPRGYRIPHAHPAAARAARAAVSSSISAAWTRSSAPRSAQLESVEGVGDGARAGDPRGPAPATGAQPRRSVPAAARFSLISARFGLVRPFSATLAPCGRRIDASGFLDEMRHFSQGRSGLYDVGDKVVYPHHGAGTVVKKEKREVLGQQREYLTIKILHKRHDRAGPVRECREGRPSAL